MWIRNARVVGILILALAATKHSKAKNGSVVLLEGAAQGIAQPCSRSGPPRFDATWQPTDADVHTMESRFSRLSQLPSQGGMIGIHIKNPESYYRQYLGIVVRNQKLIYINAFSAETPPTNWQQRLIFYCDGGAGFWGVIYDPASGEFSDLKTNGIA
jgi:hypothetical protein